MIYSRLLEVMKIPTEIELDDEMVDRLYQKYRDLEKEIIGIAIELALKESKKMGKDKVDSALFQHILASLYFKIIVAFAKSYSDFMAFLEESLDNLEDDD